MSESLSLLAVLVGRRAASELIERHGGLAPLAACPAEELCRVRGVGPWRAGLLRAAFELAGALARERLPARPLLDEPAKVAGLLREQMRPCRAERLLVLLLDARKRWIGTRTVGVGGLNTVAARPREVFAEAILARASGIVLAHNHPSGDPAPSEADMRFTRELKRAGQLLGIEVVDHVILGRADLQRERDYVSLKEMGCMYE